MATSTVRAYRVGVTWLLAAPEAIKVISAPTAAEITAGLAAGTIYNVTCALSEDDTTFEMGDSDTDDAYSYCSDSGDSTLTFYNPSVALSAFRDADRTATGVFNGTTDRLLYPDAQYLVIKRQDDKNSNDPFVAGDNVKIIGASTDYPQDVISSGDSIRITNEMLPSGDFAWNVVLA